MELNKMELTMDELAMVNGGDVWDHVVGFFSGAAAGAFTGLAAGGLGGLVVAGPAGAVTGGLGGFVVGAAAGGVAGGIAGAEKIRELMDTAPDLFD